MVGPLNKKESKKELIYFKVDAGRYFDKKDFLSWINKRVTKTISYFDMFEYNSRILIAVNGDVRSVVLLYLLSKIEKKFPRAKMAIAYIDEGISGYSDRKLSIVKKLATKFDLPLHVVRFKDSFGFTVDTLANHYENICEICKILKRWLLNDLAYKIGYDRIALGRTLEDVAFEILMYFVRNKLNALLIYPFTPERLHRKLVPIVKPLMFLKKKEIILFAHLQNLPFSTSICPYFLKSMEKQILQEMYRLEEKYPGMLFGLLNFAQSFFVNTKEKPILRECKICGYPSSDTLCEAHQLLEHIRTLMQY